MGRAPGRERGRTHAKQEPKEEERGDKGRGVEGLADLQHPPARLFGTEIWTSHGELA